MKVGTRLGRYVLERLLNTHSVNQVWLATIAGSGDFRAKVIIKISCADTSSEMCSKRLEEEGHIGCMLSHSGLAKVYESGLSNSLPFIVREYVRGCCLGTVSAQQETNTQLLLHPFFLLSVFVDVCAALQYAHENSGAIHGNLQLSKILVSYTGEVKLIDFGHSLSEHAPDSPPELLSQKTPDISSDVYNLGRLLYLTLTGKILSAEMSRVELGHAINASLLHSNLDIQTCKQIVAIIVKAVSQAPNARHSTVGKLGIALSSCLANRAPSRDERAMLMASLFPGAKDIPSHIRKRHREEMVTEQGLEIEFEPIEADFAVLLDDAILDEDLPALSVLKNPKKEEQESGSEVPVSAPPLGTQVFASVPDIPLAHNASRKTNVFSVSKNYTEDNNTLTPNVFGRRRTDLKSSTQDLFGGGINVDDDDDDWPWEPSLLERPLDK